MEKSTSAKRNQPPSKHHDELVPDKQARKECGGVSRMTFFRWERTPDLQFPPAVIINGRKYRPRSELDQFIERRKASRPLKARGR
jgi:predicted DNA-binding transcriptional regulator AlpA